MNRTVLFVCIILLSGCSEQSISPAGRTDYTRSPEISRIISAAPSVTEIIAGLGLAGCLIAVDRYSQDVEGVPRGLPEIDFFNPSIEAVAALNPDILITGEINNNGNADTPYRFMQKLGIRVLEIPTSSSIEEIYSDIVTIAQVLGVPEKGEELAGQMKNQIQRIVSSVQSETNKIHSGTINKKVYFEIAPAPNIVSFGQGTYLNELIEAAGAENIFIAEKRYFTPGAEAIISANPDFIFILTGISDIAEVKNRPGFRHLDAVRQNRIYSINANRASRPSQYIVYALEEIYRALYAN